MTKSASQLKAEIDALTKLERSAGWKIVRQVMEREVRTLVAMMANAAKDDRISQSTIHHRLGAIWAAEKLLSLPALLAEQAVADLRIREDNGPPDDAAG